MNKQLEELRAAALAATPGPWISGDDSWSDGDNANITTEERNEMGIIDIAQVNGGGSESDLDGSFRTEQQANARYIAEANPAVVLALLAELEELNAENTLLRETGEYLINEASDAQQRAEAAEAKLATPVRLPQRCRCEGYHIDEAYLVEDDEGDCFDRDEVIEILLEQGFKVEVDA